MTTMRATIHRGLLAALTLVVLTSSGCLALAVGGAAGAGTAVYVMGKLEDKVPQDVPTVHEAVLAALKDLKMPVKEDKADKVTAETRSELSNDKNVTILLNRETQATTKISIRVGLTGDEQQSLEILTAIKKHLPPAETPKATPKEAPTDQPKDEPKPSAPKELPPG